jgi:hypothetical protein
MKTTGQRFRRSYRSKDQWDLARRRFLWICPGRPSVRWRRQRCPMLRDRIHGAIPFDLAGGPGPMIGLASFAPAFFYPDPMRALTDLIVSFVWHGPS